jgi:hypothetical protein
VVSSSLVSFEIEDVVLESVLCFIGFIQFFLSKIWYLCFLSSGLVHDIVVEAICYKLLWHPGI